MKNRERELTFIRTAMEKTRTAVVTGPAAALLRGIDGAGYVRTVDVLLPGHVRPSSQLRRSKYLTYHAAQLPDQHIVDYKGLRVTSLIRTFFDVHRYYGHFRGVATMDAARQKWPSLNERELLNRARQLKGMRGISQFRRAIAQSHHAMESPLETRARLTLEAAQLPGITSVEYQVWITLVDRHGRTTYYRCDMLINGYLILECDGTAKYLDQFGNPIHQDIVQERLREHHLLSGGFAVLRAHWQDTDPENPTTCPLARKLRDALNRYPAPATPPGRTIHA